MSDIRGMNHDASLRAYPRPCRSVCAVVVVVVLSSLLTIPAALATGVVAPDIEDCFLAKHNAERQAIGLHPLIMDETLQDFARAWSATMETSG